MLLPHVKELCIFLIVILHLTDIGHGEKRVPRKGVYQVLNQPKGGRTMTKPIPKELLQPSALVEPEPPSELQSPIDPNAGSNTGTGGSTLPPFTGPTTKKLSPLLDFPAYDDEPLLDFPDPIDVELRRKFGGYDKACDMKVKKERKSKAKRRKRDQRQDIVHETLTQNRRLKQALVWNAIEDSPIPEHNPVMGFKILDQTTEIFQAICPDQYVPKKFITNAMYAFKKLHHLTGPDRTEFLSQEDFDWITAALSSCVKNGTRITDLRFFGKPPCNEEIQAVNEKMNWICTPWKEDFNKYAYDPLLDLIWHVYNAVHNYCIKDFKDNYQMIHKYGAAIMDLYSTAIRQRWDFQVEGNATDFEFWDLILGPSHELFFLNIERCTQGAAELHMKGKLVPRFIIGGSVRYDRNLLKVANPYTATG